MAVLTRLLTLLLIVTMMMRVCECRDLANCKTRTRMCNGDYFCANICTKGTVQVEAYSRVALALQRNLQKKEVVARNTFIGSHNSAISQAYGFGIEMDGIEKLLNTTLYDNDDIGEGVDQNFAVTDQLNLGLRHIEIDITAGYFLVPPKINEIFVCHSPVPLDPSVILRIEKAAKRKGVNLGDWKPNRLSCLGTRVPFQTMLEEIKAWLIANPDEFVILYLDTKPLTVVTKGQANAASKVMRDVFGDMIWAKSDGNVLNKTIEELLSAGKRLFFEDHDDGYNKADDVIVFTPDVWSHQFDDTDLLPFPNCSISGDNNWYTPVGAPAKNMVRGLYTNGSDLDSGWEANPLVRFKATKCGVNIVSPNYVQPLDMSSFVWTWNMTQPQTDAGDCVVQLPSGRWAVSACDQARSLPLACRARGDDRRWVVQAAGTACAEGYVAVPPTNGFANAWLREVASNKTVWLNVSLDGLGPAPVTTV